MANLTDLAIQSNAVAQQNNPEFAALNAAIQARPTPYNGLADFIAKNEQFNRQLADRQKDRDLQLKLQQNAFANNKHQHRQSLIEEYYANGGMDQNAVGWDEARLISNIYNLKRQNNQQLGGQFGSSPNGADISTNFQNFAANSLLNQIPYNTPSEMAGDYVSRLADYGIIDDYLKKFIQNPDIMHNLSDENLRKTIDKTSKLGIKDLGTQTIKNYKTLDRLGTKLAEDNVIENELGKQYGIDFDPYDISWKDLTKNAVKAAAAVPFTHGISMIDFLKNPYKGQTSYNKKVMNYHDKVVNASNKYKELNGIEPLQLNHNRIQQLQKLIINRLPNVRQKYDISNIFIDPQTDAILLLNKETGTFDEVR